VTKGSGNQIDHHPLGEQGKETPDMRQIALIMTLLTGLTLGACTPQERSDLKDDAKSAGAEVKSTTKDILSDPNVKEAGAAVKSVGAKAAGAIKDGAAEAESGLATSADKDRTQARSGEAETP